MSTADGRDLSIPSDCLTSAPSTVDPWETNQNIPQHSSGYAVSSPNLKVDSPVVKALSAEVSVHCPALPR